MLPTLHYMRAPVVALIAVISGCSGEDENPAPVRAPAETTDPGVGTAPAAPPAAPAPAPAPPPADDPGPPPVGCPDIKKDGDGFFTRTTSSGSYVGYVPKSYAGKPTRLVVGLHGCGDSAYNYATWAVAPWDSRDTQDWIAIAVDGASGGGSCWSTKNDSPKVFEAIADIRTCFYVHQQEVVLQGYSSGGEIGYALALGNASKFAGLLIEDSGLYATGQADTLLAKATRKIPIAHLTHQDDPVFPIDQVQSDWTKIKAAGFPIQTTVTAGDHNGTSDDWVQWLHPKMSGWKLGS